MSNRKQVTVFSTETCPWCKVAKAYLTDNEIEFEDVDIIHDLEGRRRMVLMTGQHGVPVILVGEKAIIGWDEPEFVRLYELRPKT